MGDWIKGWVTKAITSALGLVLFIGWISVTGGDDEGHVEQLAELPAAVFDGGGGMVGIELELNEPAELHATFERWDENDESETVSVVRSLEPGDHSFEVDLSEDAYAFFQVGIDEPPVGAEMSWRVTLDGELLTEETQQLDKPLDPRYAFALIYEIEDVVGLAAYLAER
jgi:hypothetical protein